MLKPMPSPAAPLNPWTAISQIDAICRKFLVAARLRLTFQSIDHTFTFSGENMTFSMLASQKVTVIGSPVTAVLDTDGNPTSSSAILSNVVYTSSDSTVFTVSSDPNTPNGGIISGVGAGSATLTETATAIEPDGTTTESIQGVATIVITATPPPPPPVAASLVFTFGTPA